MVKKSFLQACVLILVFMLGSWLGFHVGAEKMWAHANIYFGSGALNRLRGPYPTHVSEPIDERKMYCQSNVSDAVDAYVRHITRWEYKVWSDGGWEDFTDRQGRVLLNKYAEFAKIRPQANFEEHWNSFWAELDYIKEMKVQDPALYEEHKLEIKQRFERFQEAFNRLGIK